MIIDFGFDLAGRREPRLWRGFIFGVFAALAESIPYAELCRVVVAVMERRASLALAVEAFFVLFIAVGLTVLLKACTNIDNYSAVYRLVADGRLVVADHLARLPMGMFTHARRGAIVELLTGRFALYQDVVARAWGLVVANFALPIFLWCILLAADWRLALVAAIFIPVALLAIPWSHRLLSRASDRLAVLRDNIVAGLVDQLEGMRDLRQFDSREHRRLLMERQLTRFEAEQMKTELAPAPAILAFAFLLQVGFAATAIIGAYMVTRGSIAASSFLLFLIIALRFYGAIMDLGLNLAELRFARDTLQRIRKLVAEPALPEPLTGRAPNDASIAFDDVSFSYADNEVLTGISGHIESGTMVALVGLSGSGKSTLAHLVARLWEVKSGSIRIGGVDLREMSADTLNRTVAMVLQDVVLFEGTVSENIRLGRMDATDAEVEAVARAARAHDFICKLPSGYKTSLQGGGKLSGGERQRIAIARALLKDARVLILDEATANVDLENEAEIQAALSELTKDRTVIVIAHRLWTITSADQIWVLDGGRIVQTGTHPQLVAQVDAPYCRLWQAQNQAREWRIAAR